MGGTRDTSCSFSSLKWLRLLQQPFFFPFFPCLTLCLLYLLSLSFISPSTLIFLFSRLFPPSPRLSHLLNNVLLCPVEKLLFYLSPEGMGRESKDLQAERGTGFTEDYTLVSSRCVGCFLGVPERGQKCQGCLGRRKEMRRPEMS